MDVSAPAQRAPRRRAESAEQLYQLLRHLVGDVLLQLGGLLGGRVSGGGAAPRVARVEGAQHARKQRRELLGPDASGEDVLGA